MLNPKQTARVLRELQRISERELTANILKPLFKRMGYFKVDHSCGPDEVGKDLICWRKDELGDTVLTVIQVKKYKPSKRASDEDSISEILRQLAEAAENPLPQANMPPQLPSHVYFITPFPVDTLTLHRRARTLEEYRTRKLKLLDGKKLLVLLETHYQEFIARVIGGDEAIHAAVRTQLSNEVLLDALHFTKEQDIQDFYTDIDFTLGHPALQHFAKYGLPAVSFHAQLSPDEWQQVKHCSTAIEDTFEISILSEPVASIDRKVREDRRQYAQWFNSREQLSHRIDDCQTRLQACLQVVRRRRVNDASADHFGWYSRHEILERLENITLSSTSLAFEDSEHLESLSTTVAHCEWPMISLWAWMLARR